MRTCSKFLTAGHLALGALAFSPACSPTPGLTFASSDANDGGVVGEASVSLVGDSGNDASDADVPPDTDEDPDAGDASILIACGKVTISNCAACPGKRLRCTVGARDECVSDCTQCAPHTFPCLHCPKAGVQGRCVALNAKNRLKCGNNNRCPCTADPSACPVIAGAAQTCMDDAANGGQSCFTCGEVGTQAVACSAGAGAAPKTCRIGDADPVCN